MSKGKQNSKPASAKGKAAQNRISQDDYVPKKFGLKYDPPTIILEYLVPSKGKLYHHKMKLNKEHLGPYTLTDEVIEFLRDKHQMYLQHKKIQDNQLEALIERLQNHGKNTKPSTAASSNRPFSAASKGNTFGSTKSNEFDPIKDSKSSSLTKPLGTSSSNTTTNSFAASKAPEATKAPPVTTTAASKSKPAPPPKDEEEEDYYEEVFEELDFEDDNPAPPKKNNVSQPTSTAAKSNSTTTAAKKFELPKADDLGFEDLDEDVDYQTLNLNKMTPEEAQLHKNKMNSTFSKNVKKPGDPGYEYDKVVEFTQGNKESEWDEEL